jgi:hypothetical protein
VERARDATCDGVARDVSDPGADLGAGDGDPKTSATARGRDFYFELRVRLDKRFSPIHRFQLLIAPHFN